MKAKKSLLLNLSPRLYDVLHRQAESLNVSVSALIRMILSLHFKRERKEGGENKGGL